MTHPAQPPVRLPLATALAGLAAVLGGMTAHPDEHNCECRRGSAEELAQLKVPDTELDLDLLRRTWQAPDWSDHASVLRRIVPQFATALVKGSVEPLFGLEEAGRSFARGRWQQWPTVQAEAVRDFLHAWWADTLTGPDPAVPAYEALALATEASATLTPWLTTWETLTDHPADDHLAKAAAERGRDTHRVDRLAGPQCHCPAPGPRRTGGTASVSQLPMAGRVRLMGPVVGAGAGLRADRD